MMHGEKPRLLDLCCKAGGAGKGYADAGFEVVGVDIEPQPNYPFEFIQADALAFPLDGFHAVHASPPCQAFSVMGNIGNGPEEGYVNLIPATRERLQASRLPYAMENVVGAPIPYQTDLFGTHGVMLCGTSFGLRVYRHRLFETSMPIAPMPCQHGNGWTCNPHNSMGRERIYAEFGRGDPEVVWRKLMGVEWMTRYEARQAIPPVFTEHIGGYLMEEVARRSGTGAKS